MNQAHVHKVLTLQHKTQDAEALFEQRLAANLGFIQRLFFKLYGQPEHVPYFDALLERLSELFKGRPKALKKLDIERVKASNWYQSEQIVGMQLYVEHFDKDLKGLHQKLPYFEELGINFLHLMPLMTRPSGESDGGYAVNSYHKVDSKYGTQKDLLDLTQAMRAKGMYLMLDFVVNHTSEEYPWAKKALKGEKKYQDYYYMYADDTLPKEFEKSLPEVFPETSPGNFTYQSEIDRWVMTVFNHYQWDLNYTNPEVFLEMLSNLMDMVNLGVDFVRFDALAFLWKKMGTISQNLPEAHELVQLFRMCLQVISPGTILLAEAIVAPRDILKYFGEGHMQGNECEVAYNASLMALLWNSIATKKTLLLQKTLERIPDKPKECTWLNYVRCHDDIGLGYDNQLIEEIGWNPFMHRKFLLDYYCQRLQWSPATGLLFMYNPKTGDGRITGSAASLLGLEKALKEKHLPKIQTAIAKITLLHGIIMAYGGIPMLYAGDEIATLNDYSFLKEADKKEDGRWVNRPKQNWKVLEEPRNKKKPQIIVFESLKALISLRKKHPVFADSNPKVLHYSGNDHLLVFERIDDEGSGILVLANFDEVPQAVEAGWMTKLGYLNEGKAKDLISGKSYTMSSGLLELEPYQLMWLAKS
ncbi:MAG: alpha-amylase family protein [Bacteroidota bacterium]